MRVRVDAVSKVYPAPRGGRLVAPRGRLARGRRRRVRHDPRSVGMREVDPPPDRGGARGAERRARHVRRRASRRRAHRRRVPGARALSVADGPRQCGLRSRGAGRPGRRARRVRPAPPGAGGPGRLRRPLPAPPVGRHAPAGGHRPGAGRRAGPAPDGRALLGPRRAEPRADAARRCSRCGSGRGGRFSTSPIRSRRRSSSAIGSS